MARGNAWWGTAPLAVGATGLLLLAFGAKWLPGDDEINEGARRTAEKIAVAVWAGDPAAREAAKEILKRPGGAPDSADSSDVEANPTTHLPERLYDKLSYRDPGALMAGRIAFYAGLILVFTAGVLLYRRTPESNHGTW